MNPVKIIIVSIACLFFGQIAYPQSIDELMSEIDAASSSLSFEGGVPRGQLRPVSFALISAGLDAKLIRFPVRVGNRVNAGDVIAEFSCDIERANNTIETAREAVAAKNLEVNLRLSQLNNVSELELSLSEAEFEIAKAEVERTTSVLSECVLRAPFSGTITEKYVEAYQYVNKGELLVELIDTDNLEVEMVLPSLNLNRYQVGRQFSFLIDETGQTINATIDRIVNVIDPVSQTVRVIGAINNASGGLMPGMSGVVMLATDDLP